MGNSQNSARNDSRPHHVAVERGTDSPIENRDIDLSLEGTGAEIAESQSGASSQTNVLSYWSVDLIQSLLPYCSAEILCNLTQTSRALRDLLRQPWIWEALCQRDLASVCESDTTSIREWHALYKYIVCNPRRRTVLYKAANWSSIDNRLEAASNTLSPSVCSDDTRRRDCSCVVGPRPCYWSSGASETTDTNDWIAYSTRSKVCLVEAIEFCAYHAFWQPLMPTMVNGVATPAYPPRSVRVWEARGPQEEDRIRALGTFALSPEQAYAPVRWHFARPELIRGGYVCIEFLGKTQRQTYPIADEYYVCVNYVHLEGRLLPNLQLEERPWGSARFALHWIGEGCCQFCRKGGCKLVCSACKNVYYCSYIDKLRDWPDHQRICSASADSGRITRTGYLW